MLGRYWNTADRKKTKTPLARGLAGFLELIWKAKHFGKLDIAVVNAGILMLGDVGTVRVEDEGCSRRHGKRYRH
jgi:hypothetical protein